MEVDEGHGVIAMDVALKKVKQKPHYYKAMLRNKWYLPKWGCSLVTQEWMEKVRAGELWCPKDHHIKFRNCAEPPSHAEVLRIFEEELAAANDKDVGIDPDHKHVPDKKWMLDLISTLKPSHRLFDKDYVPPMPEKSVAAIKYVQDTDGFFAGLPDLYRSRDVRSTHATALVSKKDRLQ